MKRKDNDHLKQQNEGGLQQAADLATTNTAGSTGQQQSIKAVIMAQMRDRESKMRFRIL